jgi:hypothetical protein
MIGLQRPLVFLLQDDDVLASILDEVCVDEQIDVNAMRFA